MSERYEIRGRISQGGVGAVYRAWDIRLEREVAVKRLLPPEDDAQAESAAQSLKREANALSALQHPNIIMIYGIEHDDEGPFLVLELIDGVNLEQFVEQSARDGTLSQEQFLSIAEQVLDALAAGQAIGLTHRDIKPENIMLRRMHGDRLLVKVLDFGLAKFSAQPSLQTIDQSGSILGSIYFMAPEQFERLPLDHRTDMYSVGCVFYYLLASRYPFDGDTMAAVMESHLYHKVTPLWEQRPDIDPSLAAWVMKFIERTSDDRYPNADVALSALRNWKSGTTGQRGQPTEAQRRVTSRQPILSGSSSQRIAPGRRPATGQVGRASQLLAVGGPRPATGRQPLTSSPQRPPTGAVRPATGSIRPGTGVVRPGTGVIRPGTGRVRTASGRVRTASGLIPVDSNPPEPRPLDRSTLLKLIAIGATALGLLGLLVLIWFLFRTIHPPDNNSLLAPPAPASLMAATSPPTADSACMPLLPPLNGRA